MDPAHEKALAEQLDASLLRMRTELAALKDDPDNDPKEIKMLEVKLAKMLARRGLS